MNANMNARDELLTVLSDIRSIARQMLAARRAGQGLDLPETIHDLEWILKDLDRTEEEVRAHRPLPPVAERRLMTTRIALEWYPRTELGSRIMDLGNLSDLL